MPSHKLALENPPHALGKPHLQLINFAVLISNLKSPSFTFQQLDAIALLVGWFCLLVWYFFCLFNFLVDERALFYQTNLSVDLRCPWCCTNRADGSGKSKASGLYCEFFPHVKNTAQPQGRCDTAPHSPAYTLFT